MTLRRRSRTPPQFDPLPLTTTAALNELTAASVRSAALAAEAAVRARGEGNDGMAAAVKMSAHSRAASVSELSFENVAPARGSAAEAAKRAKVAAARAAQRSTPLNALRMSTSWATGGPASTPPALGSRPSSAGGARLLAGGSPAARDGPAAVGAAGGKPAVMATPPMSALGALAKYGGTTEAPAWPSAFELSQPHHARGQGPGRGLGTSHHAYGLGGSAGSLGGLTDEQQAALRRASAGLSASGRSLRASALGGPGASLGLSHTASALAKANAAARAKGLSYDGRLFALTNFEPALGQTHPPRSRAATRPATAGAGAGRAGAGGTVSWAAEPAAPTLAAPPLTEAEAGAQAAGDGGGGGDAPSAASAPPSVEASAAAQPAAPQGARADGAAPLDEQPALTAAAAAEPAVAGAAAAPLAVSETVAGPMAEQRTVSVSTAASIIGSQATQSGHVPNRLSQLNPQQRLERAIGRALTSLGVAAERDGTVTREQVERRLAMAAVIVEDSVLKQALDACVVRGKVLPTNVLGGVNPKMVAASTDQFIDVAAFASAALQPAFIEHARLGNHVVVLEDLPLGPSLLATVRPPARTASNPPAPRRAPPPRAAERLPLPACRRVRQPPPLPLPLAHALSRGRRAQMRVWHSFARGERAENRWGAAASADIASARPFPLPTPSCPLPAGLTRPRPRRSVRLLPCHAQLARLQRIFNSFDTEQKGELSRAAFEQALTAFRLQFTPEELAQVVAIADSDKNGPRLRTAPQESTAPADTHHLRCARLATRRRARATGDHARTAHCAMPLRRAPAGKINYIEFVNLMSDYKNNAKLPEFMTSRVWRTSGWMQPKQPPRRAPAKPVVQSYVAPG